MNSGNGQGEEDTNALALRSGLTAVFHATKGVQYASFLRQLNVYGFRRVPSGPDKNAYYHECFLRGRPDLCDLIRRYKNGCRGPVIASHRRIEPNFDCMSRAPAFATGGKPRNDAAGGKMQRQFLSSWNHSAFMLPQSMARSSLDADALHRETLRPFTKPLPFWNESFTLVPYPGHFTSRSETCTPCSSPTFAWIRQPSNTGNENGRIPARPFQRPSCPGIPVFPPDQTQDESMQPATFKGSFQLTQMHHFATISAQEPKRCRSRTDHDAKTPSQHLLTQGRIQAPQFRRDAWPCHQINGLVCWLDVEAKIMQLEPESIADMLGKCLKARHMDAAIYWSDSSDFNQTNDAQAVGCDDASLALWLDDGSGDWDSDEEEDEATRSLRNLTWQNNS